MNHVWKVKLNPEKYTWCTLKINKISGKRSETLLKRHSGICAFLQNNDKLLLPKFLLKIKIAALDKFSKAAISIDLSI